MCSQLRQAWRSISPIIGWMTWWNCCHNSWKVEANLIKVGTEIACVLPAEALKRLDVKDGDTLLGAKTNEGIVLTTADEKFRKEMALAEDIMRRYDNHCAT